jgi:acyl-CoA synthetase (AMP-forming)/AMP-acid ligase II
MTRTPPGIDFGRFIAGAVPVADDKTALIDEVGSATFGEVERAANGLARAFLRAGALPGARAALILPNSIPFVVTEIAIIKSGMVKVPLNIRFHAREVLYALEDCEPTVLVCTPAYAHELAAQRQRMPSLRAIFIVGEQVDGCESYEASTSSGQGDPVRHRYEPDDPILIRYTGGTTGRPKGIVHTDRSFTSIHLDVIRELALQQSDIGLQLGHLSHGNNFVWAAFYALGATQLLHEKFEPQRVLADIERHRVTFTYMVPTMLQRLLREDDGSHDLSSLRVFWITSAPMPVPVLRQAIERYGSVFYQAYTLSESPVITTIMGHQEHQDWQTSAGPRLGSCGRQLLTMELRLLDDDGREVAPGEVGEIAVRSVNNMAEYWRLPEETARTLKDGWVLTGDMARQDEEGYYYIVDRKKDLIITGAFNVYPKEVEDVLYMHPGVAQAAVVGVPSEEWGEAIKAYVVRRPGHEVSAEELIQLCRDHLASYKKPREVAFVDALPLTPVGKIMRRALRKQARTEAGVGTMHRD